MRKLILSLPALIISGMLLVCATTYRKILFEAVPAPTIFPEFRSIVLFLPDYGMLALLVITGVYLLLDASFRSQIAAISEEIIQQGGIAWIGLILWSGISQSWAAEPILARYHTLHLMACLIVLLITAYLVRQGWHHPMLIALVVGGAVQGYLALGQVFRQGPLGLDKLGEIRWDSAPSLYRGNGLTVNPNNLAGYLLVAFWAWIALFYSHKYQRGQLALAGAGLVGGLIATFSRTAWLALGISGLCLLFLAVRRWQGTRRAIWTAAAVFGLMGISLLILLLIPTTHDRLLQGREFYWTNTRAVIEQSPWTGAGAGNLLIEIQHQPRYTAYQLPVHNVYLMIWGETGLIGMLLFLAGSGAVFWQGWHQRNVVWTVGWLALSVTMFFDYYFWGDNRLQVLLFWMAGMIWGTLKEAADPVRGNAPPPPTASQEHLHREWNG
ncbi:MAG TPA: O-antigen ligase family protein [Aggregatilineaceae bacterium]|nr:O-antigen ligase family protein [Aggregatilineaceae bacterium]